MTKAILIFLALAAVSASATKVNICGTGGWFSDPDVDSTSATIVGCEEPPCKVTKGELITYSLKFTPSSTIDNLTAHVRATRWGLFLTILDGPSVCDKIFNVSDDSPASCPLSPGVEYIYKDAVIVPTFIAVDRGNVQLTIKSGSETVKCIEAPVLIS